MPGNVRNVRFSDRYRLEEVLGKGSFAVVYRCVDKRNGKNYAVKVIKEENWSQRDRDKLDMEAKLCKRLNHPHIVRLITVMNEPRVHYLVFDLVTGGELFEDIVKEENYTEELAAKCMWQLLDTIKYIHSVGVVHRDLKPENILLESVQTKIIKVADFGMAVVVNRDELKWFGMVGTLHYMAPEVFEFQPYGKPVDIWACGVIMYILLVGYQPFHHKIEWRLHAMIKAGDYELTSEPWTTISREAKDLIIKLLCVVPSRRFTAAQALTHPWFRKSKTRTVHREDTVQRLREFNARRMFRAAFHTVNVVRSLQDIP